MFEAEGDGMVLGADREVPVPVCHQLVLCLGNLGKAYLLTYYLPSA